MAKGGKKKKQVLKFTLDCTHPVEDGIMDAANFVSDVLLLWAGEQWALERCSGDPVLGYGLLGSPTFLLNRSQGKLGICC